MDPQAVRLAVDYVGEPDAGLRQINAAVPGDFEAGEHGLRVCFGAVSVEHAALVRVVK